MRFLVTGAIGALIACAVAAPAPVDHVLHEKRELAHGWVKRDRLPLHEDLPVRIGLMQRNLEHAERFLEEVSDPDSHKYGQHFTEDEVNDLFAPHQDAVDEVLGWLHDHGFDPKKISQSFNKQWIQFDAKVEEIERLLATKYHFFEDTYTGRQGIACDEYHVPAKIQHHIDYITPGVKMHIDNSRNSTLAKRQLPPIPPILPPIVLPIPPAILQLLLGGGGLPLSLCGAAITPQCIMTMYKIPPNTQNVAGNDMGVFEDLGDKYAQQDLDNFFLTLYPTIPTGTHPTLHAIDGATAPASIVGAGIESDLDFQISYPIIYPQNSILFQTDDNHYESHYTFRGFFNDFLYAVDGSYCKQHSPLDPKYPDPAKGGYKGKVQCGKYKPTNVVSISYGGQEPSLPVAYQRRQCLEYMKLGLRGVTTVMASGDSGVGTPSGKCPHNNAHFDPDFAASCPYILAAGATTLPPGANPATDHETATTQFGSGGGFSNIYLRPSYQQSAVETYLTKHKPPYKSYKTSNNPHANHVSGKYNRAGRGYPDVSSVGQNVVIFNKGAPNLVGGTSAAAPVISAILTRINGERIKAGKKPVGFVNPVFYKNPGMFHDVTQGSNPGCGTNGFKAAPGWDPLTGLGTPDYPKMLSVFMALP